MPSNPLVWSLTGPWPYIQWQSYVDDRNVLSADHLHCYSPGLEGNFGDCELSILDALVRCTRKCKQSLSSLVFLSTPLSNAMMKTAYCKWSPSLPGMSLRGKLEERFGLARKAVMSFCLWIRFQISPWFQSLSTRVGAGGEYVPAQPFSYESVHFFVKESIELDGSCHEL